MKYSTYIYRKIILLSLACGFSCTNMLGIYKKIEQENMKSFSFPAKEPFINFDTYTKYLKWDFKRQLNLPNIDKRRFVYELFQEYEKTHTFEETDTLDFTTWQDLNLLTGPKSNKEIYLGAHIDKAATELGKVTLYRMIVNPTADIQKLLDRQAIVQELITNQLLFDELDTVFQKLHASENLLYSFWQEDAFKSAAQHKAIRIPGLKFVADKLNKSHVCLEVTERLEEVKELAFFGLSALSIGAISLYLFHQIMGNEAEHKRIKELTSSTLGSSGMASFFTIVGLASWLVKKVVNNPITEGAHDAATAATFGLGLLYPIDNFQSSFVLLTSVQTKLMAVADALHAMNQCEFLIKTNVALQRAIPTAGAIRRLYNEIPKRNADFKNLLTLLSADTFKGKPSHFSRAGTILAAYKLMNEQKQQLVDALVFLGEMDAYMAIARLYKEGQNRGNTWCFATYMHEDHPSLTMANFWNPLLDPQRAVANSVSIGINNPRTLIVTGPNAGGKSTTVKAIVTSLILAQSIGIAPAEAMTFTPFTKIMTYLNITDDIAAGNSHFKAGVLRAQELVSLTKTLHGQDFGFVAVDELFNGTTYKEGQAAAYSLIEYLGHQPQILGITATHFPLITNLEEKTNGQLFKNYKVSVGYDAQGKIAYPFKIEPGISHQNVALDILREEGFKGEFMARALEVLQEIHDLDE